VLPDTSRRLTNQEKEKQHSACADALLGKFRLPLTEPLHEWQQQMHFWGQSHPHLFMPNANGDDIPASLLRRSPRARDISLSAWAAYMMEAQDYRYHTPAFVFGLLNFKQRQQALSDVGYVLRTAPGDTPHTKESLAQMVALDTENGTNNFAAIVRRMHTCSRNVLGSPAYKWVKRDELTALVEQQFEDEGEMPLLFVSGSCAEFQWAWTHALALAVHLSEYAKRIANACDDDDGDAAVRAAANKIAGAIVDLWPPACAKPNLRGRSNFYRKAKFVQRCAPGITKMFTFRTDCWFRIVLVGGVGCSGFWYIFEFADKRGQIHFHGFGYASKAFKMLSAVLGELVEKYFKAEIVDIDQLSQEENVVAQKLEKMLPQCLLELSAGLPLGEQQKPKEGRAGAAADGAAASPDHGGGSAGAAAADGHHVFGGVRYTRHTTGSASSNGATLTQWAERVKARNPMAVAAEFEEQYVKQFPSIVNEVGDWTTHLAEWSSTHFIHPEGKKIQQEPPWGSPLCTPTYKVERCNELEDLVNYINTVLMHICSGYCLRLLKNPQTKNAAIAVARDEKVCRSHFGAENKVNRTTRTDGKVARQFAGLVQEAGITRFAAIRNHARKVLCADVAARAARANVDVQLVLSPSARNSSVDSDELSFEDWQSAVSFEMERVAGLFVGDEDRDYLELLRLMYKSRRYFSPRETMRVLVQYACAYACKNEQRPCDARRLVQELITSDRLPPSSSYKSLACRANLLLIKGQIITLQAAVFINMRQALTHSTSMFNHINAHEGTVSVADSGGVRSNWWTRYRKDQQTNPPKCFHDFVRENGRVAVYNHGTPRASVPLNELWCRINLLKYREGCPPIEDPVQEMKVMLWPVANGCSEKHAVMLRRQLHDAIFHSQWGSAGTHTDVRKQRKQQGESSSSSSDSDDQDSSDDAHGDSMDCEQAVREAPLGYLPPGIDRSLYDVGALRTWLQRMQQAAAAARGREVTLVNPLRANEKQRVFLHRIVKFLLAHKDGDGDTLRMHLCGVAGTGKTFCINVLQLAVALRFGSAESTALCAPTGAAACGIGGETVDRCLNFRRAKGGTPPLQASVLAQRRAEFAKVRAFVIDEQGMVSARMYGSIASRLSELSALSSGVEEDGPEFGGIPIMVTAGDSLQLAPIGKSVTSAVLDDEEEYGRAAYLALDQVYALTQPMRQNPTSAWYQFVHRSRRSRCSADAKIAAEYAAKLFRAPPSDVLTLHARYSHAEVEAANEAYVLRQENVAIAVAELSGTHHQSDKKRSSLADDSKAGMLHSIPRHLHLCIGGTYRLKCNITGLVSQGLTNGATATLKDYVFGNDTSSGYNAKELPLCIFHMPSYSGPPVPGLPDKCVPFVAIKKSCGSFCCSREGLPFVVAHTITIHTTQGMSIGAGQLHEHCCGQVSTRQEGSAPGLFYTLISRATTAQSFSFSTPPSQEFFEKLATSPSWQRKMEEDDRLHAAAKMQEVEDSSTAKSFAADWRLLFKNSLSGGYGEFSTSLARALWSSTLCGALHVVRVANLRMAFGQLRKDD
jgi:hypothetical protein